jgi:rsbT antagonist protein RsbS
MTVPILRQGKYLIASVQGSLSDRDLDSFQTRMLTEARRCNAAGAVIDVSVLDVLDSFGTRMLGELVIALRLCGTRGIIVGIQPEVAFAMVMLGMHSQQFETALDLDAGLAMLAQGAAQS